MRCLRDSRGADWISIDTQGFIDAYKAVTFPGNKSYSCIFIVNNI
jgi:hypothetical protein